MTTSKQIINADGMYTKPEMDESKENKHILLKCVLENCHEDLLYARQCSSVNNNKKKSFAFWSLQLGIREGKQQK